ERIRIEIGFDGGQVMSAYVQTSVADDLVQSLNGSSGGTAQIEAEDGQYTISLARIVWVKRFSREGRVGFSGGVEEGGKTPPLGAPPFLMGERGAAGKSLRARGRQRLIVGRAPAGGRRAAPRGVPAPLQPHLRLPLRHRRQPARCGGPDDADVPADARVDRQLPLAFRSVLGLAPADRAQPRDGPLPRSVADAARSGRVRPRRRDL